MRVSFFVSQCKNMSIKGISILSIMFCDFFIKKRLFSKKNDYSEIKMPLLIGEMYLTAITRTFP